MCQEKIQQHSVPFNITDNMILNPLGDHLLSKRYWVLENKNDLIEEKPQEITIILNRKRRSFMIQNPFSRTIVKTVRQVKNWNWQSLVDNSNNADKTQITRNIHQVFEKIRNGGKEIDEGVVKTWSKTYRILSKTRTNQKFIRTYEKWNELTDEFGKGHLKKYLEELDPKLRVLWKNKLNKVMLLIKNKKFNKLDPKLLIRWKQLIYKLKLKIYGKDNYKQRILINWENHVKWLIKWKWTDLLQYVSEKYKSRVTNTINELLIIVKNKDLNKIILKLVDNVNFSMRLLRRLWTIHIKYGGREKAEIIRDLKTIVTIDWLKILDQIDGINKEEWKTKFKKIILLIKSQRYNEIDLKFLQEFKEIIKKIKIITKVRPPISKRRIQILTKYVHLLKKWNWPKLVEFVNPNEREKLTTGIKRIIEIIEQKRYNEIDNHFVTRIRFIVRFMRKIKYGKVTKIDVNKEKKKLIRKIKFLININWLQIINETKGIDKIKWTNRINKLIQLIKSNQIDKIDLKWLRKFRKIIKIINRKVKEKPITVEIMIKKLDNYVKKLKKWNWLELLKNVDEKDRINYIKEIELLIGIINQKRYKNIDINFFNRMKVIFRTLKKLKKGKLPKINVNVQREKLLNKLKPFINTNWQKIINETKGIDKVKWTNRINKLIQLIKLNQPDKIDLKWLQKFNKIIRIINKKKPTIKVITKNVKKFVNRLIKWNWPDLIKNIDEKDRENVKKEIELILKLVKENRFKEIDENLYKKIRVIFKTVKKIKDDKYPKIDVKTQKEKLINKLKVIIDTNWQKVINETKGIDKVKWTNRINKLIQLIKLNQPDKIDIKLLQKFQKLIKIIHNKIKVKPLILKVITKTVKKYVDRLIKWNWPDLIKNIDVKERENVKNQIELILKLVKENRFNEIDENLYKKIRVIFQKVKQVKIDKEPKVDNKEQKEKLIKKLKVIIDSNWQKVINETKGIDKIKWTNRINKLIQLINLNQPDKIDNKWLQKFNKLIKVINKNIHVKVIPEKVINKTVNTYVNRLIKWNWPDLIKNVDEKDRENVKKQIELVLKLVKENRLKEIDENLFKKIRVVYKTIEKIKKVTLPKVDIKVEKEKSIEKLKPIINKNWLEIINNTKNVDKVKWTERINKIIQLVKLNETEKIDIKWLKELEKIFKIKKLPETEEITIDIKPIVDKANKFVIILKELNWEELVKNIDETSRPEVVNKIKKLIKLVDNKEFENIDVDLINWITEIINTFKKIKEIQVTNEKTKEEHLKKIKEISDKYINDLKLLKWEELIKFIDEGSRPEVVNKIKKFVILVDKKEYENIDTDLINWITEIINTLKKINEIQETNEKTKEKNRKTITDASNKYITIIKELKWEELIKYIDEKDRPNVEKKIRTFITLVEKKDYDNIDTDLISWITTIITTLKQVKEVHVKNEKVTEENKKVITDTSNKYITIIKELKWEELIKYIDEKDRPNVEKKIRTFITLVEKKDYDNIDTNLINWITTIITTLKQVKEVHVKNENITKENIKIITDNSNKYITILNQLKWEELVKNIDESNRPEVVNKIKTFITFVNNKQYEKIDSELINWIIQIVETLKKIKEVQTTNEKNNLSYKERVIKLTISYLEFLNELKWEELVKYIDKTNQQEVVQKIKTFIILAQNKKYDEIDSTLLNWINQIITTLRQIREIHVKNEKTKEHNLKTITELSIKYIDILNELKWEQLIKYIDEKNRPEVVDKIKTFIKFALNKEYDKIDTDLINWITQIITTLRKVNEVHTKNEKIILENKKIITETSNKYIKFLIDLKWEELVTSIDEKNRPEVISKIKKFVTLVQNKQYENIDTELISWITQIIEVLRKINEVKIKNNKINEENRKVVTDSSNKYIKILNELKWEELIRYIDEKNRPEVADKIKKFIKFTENKEYDKIDIDFVNWIIEIVNTLKKVREIHDKNEKVKLENRKLITDTSNKYINFLTELKWEELIKYIDEKSRPEVENKIKTFIKFVQNKEYDKIDTDLISWITQITTTLRKVHEVHIKNEKVTAENRKTITDTSNKYITIINELKWEELVKYIAENNRGEVVNKIKTFVTFVQNKEYDKIDEGLINWITQIIDTLKKIRVIHDRNEKVKTENQKLVTETSDKYIILLKELKWEELIKFIEESSRPEVENKIKIFTNLVENKQFEKIDSDLINWIAQIIATLRKIREIQNKNDKITAENRQVIISTSKKYYDALKEFEWEELMKYIDENSRPEVIKKIKTFISLVENNEFDKIDMDLINWLTQIISTLRQVRPIHIKNEQIRKQNLKAITETSNKYLIILNELKWEELLKFIDEKNRPEVSKKINEFITKVNEKKYETIDVELVNWIGEIINTFRKIKVTNYTSNRKDIIKRIQITLPSNWIELLKRIEGIDHDLWIGRIKTLLSLMETKEYQKIDFDWIDDLQKIIFQISQEAIKVKKEVFLNEASISNLKNNVKLLKEWNWESYLVYIDENNRQQVQKDVTEMISIVESGTFDKLEVQFVNWFKQIFDIFAKINDAITNGYVFNKSTKTWEKNIVVNNGLRFKRSAELNEINDSIAKMNVKLINQSIQTLQKALMYNLMILKNKQNTKDNYRLEKQNHLCPFINKVNERLTTKLTNCAMKQRFICKRQLN